jgi:hypothetical protein
MVQINITRQIWDSAREHLDASAERVGFFLADWSSAASSFTVRTWKAVDEAGSEFRDIKHVSLSDATRAAMIQWAWSEDGCLIEVHSHGGWGPAAFSPFDIRQLEVWVPHLWWRLRGRPYAAIVTTTDDLDALAWVDSPVHPGQVSAIAAPALIPASRATLSPKRSDRDG